MDEMKYCQIPMFWGEDDSVTGPSSIKLNAKNKISEQEGEILKEWIQDHPDGSQEPASFRVGFATPLNTHSHDPTALEIFKHRGYIIMTPTTPKPQDAQVEQLTRELQETKREMEELQAKFNVEASRRVAAEAALETMRSALHKYDEHN
eukprot:TRINITY_DN55404_c0_g1_i1.p1 TRINITY_DN55404_c0_g1~~TRINITY_DN55404_c0_g1_i1.p1  ORF type:complete len:149 (+),score=14.96 TRINITY_DN55404_c0_g1_i1:127-573(+)